MKGLRSRLGEILTGTGRLPATPPARPGYTLTVTGALEFHGFVCVHYVVTPVPVELLARTELFEGQAGTAVDDHAVLYGQCRVAYRTAGNGTGVLGEFTVAPSLRSRTCSLRVLFPPLALTPGLDHAVSEVELAVTGNAVEPVSMRWV